MLCYEILRNGERLLSVGSAEASGKTEVTLYHLNLLITDVEPILVPDELLALFGFPEAAPFAVRVGDAIEVRIFGRIPEAEPPRGNDGQHAPFCSFCGKTQREVSKLIAGTGVFICNECIELCYDIVQAEDGHGGAPPSGAV